MSINVRKHTTARYAIWGLTAEELEQLRQIFRKVSLKITMNVEELVFADNIGTIINNALVINDD